uniref:Glycosyltransferase family 25 LPS biosynthesis protein n=1 Tax=Marseillevirus LCMAC202 TaxID=2506606 RepID=A0A481YXY1_9VIRU|nr:MAG: glycosyltransferase family 25 LPS biosynthesis protein [Marseillevirus LCMAC202]
MREFERVGISIDKYIFFPAVDANGSIVRDILKNNGRQQLVDGTVRIWKNINKYQIGNWSSYIGVWEDIIKNDYNFCLLCEDDIKFANYYKPVIDKVFNYEYLVQQGVDPVRPLVIGVGSGYQDFVHKPRKEISLVKQNPIRNRECNPCHIINKSMAVELLKHSKHIHQASDPYIHNVIGSRHQKYWVVPQPIYDLSWSACVKKFPSTIEGPLKKGDKLL